ncbi:hypothetical protein FGU65_09985 [Methanoculleus sp. FWC-SCC1]|uniref:Uncharacterized protein n=1 Tax=Methanoculleus frigidifontis TaxID=2584085 RepID=A0ABT8MBB0_9EURY|nr:hypothetical protein [Methanoculleus sp. FWC-SCC1]MDN7025214.1 hypothetical protein [Methanoculleus sp. FWC-SCC1]
MNKRPAAILPVTGGRVACPSGQTVSIEKCRFCVHSTHFQVAGKEVPSPARAYCTMQRKAEEVDLTLVEAVVCDDASGEGYRSIMNIIS